VQRTSGKGIQMADKTRDTLKRERDFMSAVLDTVDALVVVLDKQGRIVRFNRACEQLTGYAASDVLGRTVWDLFLLPEEMQPVKSVFQSLRAGHFPNRYENFWTTIDGSRRLIDWSNTALVDSQGTVEYVIATGLDLTERRQAEQEIQERTAQLEALREVGLDLIAELNLDDLLHSIVARAVTLVGATAGGFYLHRADRDLLEWVTTVGPGLAPPGATLHRGEGLSGRVWETGEPLIVNRYEEWPGRAAIYEGYSFAATIGVPVRWGDEFLGVLNVVHHNPDAFRQDDARLLGLLATQAAIAIKNARLFQAEREQRSLAEALRQATAAVSSTLELDKVLDHILDQATRVIHSDTCNVMLLEGAEARIVRWHGYEAFGGSEHLQNVTFRLATTTTLKQMHETGEPMLVPDTLAYDGWQWISDWIRSYAGAPIRVRDHVIGFLSVNSATKGFFTRAHLDPLRTFADQAGLAIQNARMFEETRRRVEYLSTLHQTALAITSDLNLHQVLDALYEQVNRIMDVGAFYVALYDQETGLIHFPLLTGQTGAHEIAPLHIERRPGITSYVIQTRQPLYLPDIQAAMAAQDPPFHIIPLIEMHTRSYIGVPLIFRDQVIGVLSVQSYEADAYQEAEVRLLTTIASQAAIAIENARMYNEARRRNRELALLNRVIAACAASQEIETMLETTCRELALAFDVPQSAAALFNPEKTEAVVVAEYRAKGRPSALGERIPVEANLASQYLLEHKAPLILDNAQTDPRQAPIHDLLRRRGTISLLLLPLLVEGEVVGSLGIDALEPRTFTAEEVALAQRVAEQVSGALARTRLQETQQRLGTAVGQAAESIFITETDGTIVYVNPAFERITGYSYEEVIGRNPRILKSGRHDSAFYREMWGTIASGQVWQGRFINRKKDGSLYIEDATITPVRNQAGEIVNYVATMRDVTREVELEDQFRQAQKMEALGRLAGGVAHDFNNLLTIIHMSTRLLERQLRAEDPLWEPVQHIREASERATDLNKQLLSFSRHQMIEPQVINLNEAVSELSRMLQRLIGEDIQLETALAEDLWPVHTDPSQLDQVIMNLVVNARDAMPQGGTLSIRTANVRLDETYAARHVDAQPGEYALLSIHDTGMGMDDETKAHLFEPFFTTKGREKGTGLGLATVFGIVKQGRGHIDVESQVGQGSTFRIYLPRARVARKAPSARAHPQGIYGNETILLVEDEEAVRALTVGILQSYGYHVLVASDGAEALRVHRTYEGPIHLLLTDVIMPQMSGRELADRLRKLQPGIRVLFMSGYADERITDDGVFEPGTAFIAKPLTIEVLTHQVRMILDSPA
jgi:PAS domain S-box-containing protein